MTAPDDVVVGVSDLAATATFLGVLGFVAHAEGMLDSATAGSRYGLDTSTSWVRLRAPGTARGGFRLVATPHVAERRSVVAPGPLAVDIYTADLDESLALLHAADIEVGAVGTIELGPLVMRQCQVLAPDGWRIVLVEANRRRPSVLDREGDRLHSEVHSILWTVPSIEAAAPGLEGLGLSERHVFPIQHPELARIIDLPAPDTVLRMNLMAAEDEPPIRVELCEFPAHPGEPVRSTTLETGVHALAFGDDPTTTRFLDGGVRVVC